MKRVFTHLHFPRTSAGFPPSPGGMHCLFANVLVRARAVSGVKDEADSCGESILIQTEIILRAHYK